MLIRCLPYRQKGLSLLELMLALFLGTILLTISAQIFVTGTQHGRETSNAARLYQELRTAMDIMSNDIRRAGYWGSARNDLGSGANNNPFMDANTNISVNGSNNCILLSYDRNSDGSLPAVGTGDDERYGYRLSNQAIQARPASANFSCTAANNSWVNITDPNIVNVTQLTFTLTTKEVDLPTGTTPASKIRLRYVDITIAGQLKNNPAITMTLNQHVRIRNDQYVP